MYAFEPRFPLDHALSFYRAVSSGDYERGDLLILVGAISGEVGAMLKLNSVSLSTEAEAAAAVMTFEQCLEQLAQLENCLLDDANFDPTPWIPIILRLIELWLSRRGG